MHAPHLARYLHWALIIPLVACHGSSVGLAKQAAEGPGASNVVITDNLHHLRWGPRREWSEFPATAEGERLQISFSSVSNTTAWCLQLRQQDVKQTWTVAINGHPLGKLRINENDMVLYFDVPANVVRDGQNELTIEQDLSRRQVADDIRVGEIKLFTSSRQAVLQDGTLRVTVTGEDDSPLPCRLTITNQAGALQTVDFDPHPTLAVRPGVVYAASGTATVRLPAGSYTITAGRGFEYGWARRLVELPAGAVRELALQLEREVPTEGYVACDTHVHTLTHSGHGDATVQERMVTLAGEGIELPIASDHNVHIDHRPFAAEVGVSFYFTPVIGNEVTTAIGHFNVFPIRQTSIPIPNHRLQTYREILASIFQTPDVRVAILNHARDVHGGTRPFDPRLHNSVVGENLSGWELGFNGMEVVNSGATQTDPLQLFHDWMGLLNRGRQVTPVGTSDSHDVARHFVGQGRTYIRCGDDAPGKIDVEQAVDNFLAGRVLVSYGLMVRASVEEKYQSGDLAPIDGDTFRIGLRVLGPRWTTADRILLFANGRLIREEEISGPRPETAGLIWDAEWTLPRPAHDTHLVAIALGPGIQDLAWPTAKPYQPTSPDWQPRVLGCSGAIWLDVDGDGRPTAAYDYARRLVTMESAPARLLSRLADYDGAVAAQVAHLLQTDGANLFEPAWQSELAKATDATRLGFRDYLTAFRASQQAPSQ